MGRLVAILAAALALASAAAAEPHAAWLVVEPVAAPGGVEIRLAAGPGVAGSSLLPDGEATISLLAEGGTSSRLSVPGADVPVRAPLRTTGLHLARYESAPTRIEVPPDEFDAFLAEEGLDKAMLWRAENGQDGEPGIALVTQRAETVFGVQGDWDSASLPAARRGLSLVPTLDNIDTCAGRLLKVAVLVDGQPAKDIQLVARTEDGTHQGQDLVSDAGGLATLCLAPATWVLSAAHVSETTDDDDAWQVWLTSLRLPVLAAKADDPASPAAAPEVSPER